jgi:hypothetical protein
LAAAPAYYANYIYSHGGLPELRRYVEQHPGSYLCAMPQMPLKNVQPSKRPAAPDSVS